MTKEFSLFTLKDPEQVKLLDAAIKSLWSINYRLQSVKGKVTGIEFMLDEDGKA